MKQFCENPYCEHPGAKVVPISVETPSDQKRTLCTSCEEAYSWGVQHGTKVARAETATSHARVDLRVNRRELATILAALRFHQDENLQGTPEIPDVAIKEIATDGGTLKPLSFEEVEALSQRLSLGQHEPTTPTRDPGSAPTAVVRSRALTRTWPRPVYPSAPSVIGPWSCSNPAA